MTRKLVTRNQAIGQALIKQAQAKFDDSQQAKVLTIVTDTLRKIEESKETIAKGKAALAFFERQVHALELGEFSFHPWRPEIIFNEAELNGTWLDVKGGN